MCSEVIGRWKSVTSIRSSAFGAFKVTRALRVAYVDMEFGVRRPMSDHVRTPMASEIGSFEHPRFLGLELATTTRHSTHKLVSFRALVVWDCRFLRFSPMIFVSPADCRVVQANAQFSGKPGSPVFKISQHTPSRME